MQYENTANRTKVSPWTTRVRPDHVFELGRYHREATTNHSNPLNFQLFSVWKAWRLRNHPLYVVKIKHFGFIFSSRNAGLKKSNRFIAFNQKSRVFFLDSAKKTVCFNNVQKVFNLPNLCWAQFCVFVAAYKLRVKTSSNRLGPKKKNHLPVPSICMGHSLVLKRGCVLQFGCWQQFFTGGATCWCLLSSTDPASSNGVSLGKGIKAWIFFKCLQGLDMPGDGKVQQNNTFFSRRHSSYTQASRCCLSPWSTLVDLVFRFQRRFV